ncbi:hypothetical protein GCM10012280_21210 [Wenjunlia tyrosinilytica]|uniref:Phenylacetate--CoA ligase n=1 Tax=Wenjunlia tyrosinilytica TaxID=1544741 RepID=A0A917ZLP6_9ACTN|nr:hypothetical protein GCM10012280_21210 [Wenjunlia tyrosinilytica]
MSESEPYDPMERASRDELGAVQPARLRGTLAHVHEHVPHYRAPLDAAGVHPEDCRALEDLARFPFTTKQDLRENYPFGMLAVPRAGGPGPCLLRDHGHPTAVAPACAGAVGGQGPPSCRSATPPAILGPVAGVRGMERGSTERPDGG